MGLKSFLVRLDVRNKPEKPQRAASNSFSDSDTEDDSGPSKRNQKRREQQQQQQHRQETSAPTRRPPFGSSGSGSEPMNHQSNPESRRQANSGGRSSPMNSKDNPISPRQNKVEPPKFKAKASVRDTIKKKQKKGATIYLIGIIVIGKILFILTKHPLLGLNYKQI